VSPAYLDLADQLAGQIRSGVYGPGDQMPSQSKLVAEGWGKQVAQDAYANLVRRGLVEGRVGAGYFVLPEPPPDWMKRLAEVERRQEQSAGEIAQLRREVDDLKRRQP
jgi:DNA-binding GntR family transcriptional regulator